VLFRHNSQTHSRQAVTDNSSPVNVKWCPPYPAPLQPGSPVWSKISNALKRLGFRSRNFLAQLRAVSWISIFTGSTSSIGPIKCNDLIVADEMIGLAENADNPGHRRGVARVAQISGGNAQANAVNSTDLAWSRLVRDQEVGGSNPLAPTNSFRTDNLQHARERKTAWCGARHSTVQIHLTRAFISLESNTCSISKTGSDLIVGPFGPTTTSFDGSSKPKPIA
jgi:hypothetical protein